MEYYTYAYLRKDKTPYYIGKGSGMRAWVKGDRVTPKPSHDRILVLKTGLTEEEAFKHERYMIAIYGRKDLGTGILRNMTDGGDGMSGHKQTEKTKAKRRGPGKPHTEETKKKISASRKANPCNTPRRGMRITLQNTTTKEVREFISISQASKELGVHFNSLHKYGKSKGWIKCV